jgi:hypothetical protein
VKNEGSRFLRCAEGSISDWNELVTELDARWDFMHAMGTFAVQNEEK